MKWFSMKRISSGVTEFEAPISHDYVFDLMNRVGFCKPGDGFLLSVVEYENKPAPQHSHYAPVLVYTRRRVRVSQIDRFWWRDIPLTVKSIMDVIDLLKRRGAGLAYRVSVVDERGCYVQAY